MNARGGPEAAPCDAANPPPSVPLASDASAQRWALRLQLALVAGGAPPEHLFELRWRRPGGPMRQQFVGVREIDRAVAAIMNLSQFADVYLSAAPRCRESGTGDAVKCCWAVWADLDSPAAVEALRGFHAPPSLLVESSRGRAQGWWQIPAGVPPAVAERCNRRLARALGGDPAAADRARIMRPAGTQNYKYDPPAAVVAVEVNLDAYTLAQVVHGLPDDPRYIRRPPAPRRGKGSGVARGLIAAVQRAPVGQRNCTLYWACRRAADERQPDEVFERLAAAAAAAGLDGREIAATVASARKAAA